MELVLLKVSDVLIDIDGTICNGSTGDPYGSLIHTVMDKLNLTYIKAANEIRNELRGNISMEEIKIKAADGDLDMLFVIAAKLKIKKEALWNTILADAKINSFSDAAYMVKELYKKGFNLHIASWNRGWQFLVKLGCAGLCNLNGSPYFKNIFNEDVMRHKKEENRAVEYYSELLKKLRRPLNKIIMIGDWEAVDLYPAVKAGIKNIIIVRRGQKEKIKILDAVYVNSLKIVPDILKKV